MSKIIKLDATLIAAASAVGKKESEGPLGERFDVVDKTDKFGKETWERAESSMQERAADKALEKAGIAAEDIGAVFAGDLMNQCTASAYGMLKYDIPYFGLYGACSTAAEGLTLAAMSVGGGYFSRCAVSVSSHYCTAERQYRTPLEYGSQRTPTAQWTVTGAACFIVGNGGNVRISAALSGIVVDAGIKDAANMGAAMAPAAADTILRFYRENPKCFEGIDKIVTGDLGFEGISILNELLRKEGLDISDRLGDCGMMIYDREIQDVHSGGSGCGCSAVVMASHFLPQLERGETDKLLFLGTGAMMSPMILQQGESIPAVAHSILLESNRGISI